MNFFIFTISSSNYLDHSVDQSGPMLVSLISRSRKILSNVIDQRIIQNNELSIIKELSKIAESFDVIITIGGTGLGPSDITPKATKKIIQRECSGIVTALLTHLLKSTPMAALNHLAAGFINFFNKLIF